MSLLYKTRTSLLFLISIFGLITCQSPNKVHFCLGPDKERPTPSFSSYKSNLTNLLDSISSKASNHTYYSHSSNGIYSLFFCRGDVSGNACQVCVKMATQSLLQVCPFDKSAVIWNDECTLQYSNINFFGQVRLVPVLPSWNAVSTSIDEGTYAIGFIYTLVDEATKTENMFKINEMVSQNGQVRRYGLVQCSRDINVSVCSNCLRELLNLANKCCTGKSGWRILAPSCFIRYETTSASPRAPPEHGGKSNRRILSSRRFFLSLCGNRGSSCIFLFLPVACLKLYSSRNQLDENFLLE